MAYIILSDATICPDKPSVLKEWERRHDKGLDSYIFKLEDFIKFIEEHVWDN